MSVVVRRRRFEASGEALRELGVDEVELRFHLPKRDERQHRLGILIGTERGIRPELIGCLKEPRRQFLEIHWRYFPLRGQSC